MNKKDKFFNEFFDNKKDDIFFVTLKKGATIKFKDYEYITSKEMPVPVRAAKLLDDIKRESEIDNVGISLNNIIDGIIYVLGTDKDFEYLYDYKEMLEVLYFDLPPYIILCINKFDDKNVDDAVIYGSALVNFNEDDKNCFIYASVLEKRATEQTLIESEIESQYFLEEAHIFYEKALDYNDKFALSYYKLGYYYKLQQQYLKAQLHWKKHQELDSDVVRIEEIRNELGQLEPYVDFENGYNLVLKEQPEEALDLLLPLVNEFGSWWNLLFFIGLAYRALGDYEIAEKYFENVLKIEEYQKETINELGLCKICRGKYTEASELFTTLLNIEPGNCEVFCNRAVAHLYNNEIDRAKEDITTALKINPDDEIALSIKSEIEQNCNL
jgi:tetratricopeptide (TPR) repeat protein